MESVASEDLDRTSASQEALRGVYNAWRTAALAGVPRRTLNYWAERGIYRPSISPEPRTRLWSWYDLLALRLIDWLRRPGNDDGLPRVSIARIRGALDDLEHRSLPFTDLH